MKYYPQKSHTYALLVPVSIVSFRVTKIFAEIISLLPFSIKVPSCTISFRNSKAFPGTLRTVCS